MFSRLNADQCEYTEKVKQSTSILTHQLDPVRYYNCNQCRITEGIIGGNAVSVFTGNLVDLESDLRGQTRRASKCPKDLFVAGTNIQNKSHGNCPDICEHGEKSGECLQKKCIKSLKHLKECKLIDYGQRINTTGINLDINLNECKNAPKSYSKKERKHKPKQKLNILWQGQQGLYT